MRARSILASALVAASSVAGAQGFSSSGGGTPGVACLDGLVGPQGPAGPTGPGFTWKGPWSSGTSYAVNDAVQSGGASYVAISANTNSAPPSGSWQLMSSAGSSGGAIGSSGALQYSNAGAFAGVANVSSDGSNLTFAPLASMPSAPSSGRTPFAFTPATGAPPLQGTIDALSQLATFQFPVTGFGGAYWGCQVPVGAGSSTMSYFGRGGQNSSVGTVSSVSWAATDAVTRTAMMQYATDGTANASAGIRGNTRFFWRGNGSGSGGFNFWGSFQIMTAVATQKVFFGISGTTSAVGASAAPSSVVDSVYVGCDTADTTLHACANDGSATASCTDLGANFPCHTANAAYSVFLWAPPSASTVSYVVRRVDSAFTASGTLSTQLPRTASSPGSWELYVGSGSTASTATVRFAGACYVGNS